MTATPAPDPLFDLVEVSFNEVLDIDTAMDVSNFSVIDSRGPASILTARWRSVDDTVELYTSNLLDGDSITVLVDGVTDVSGNPPLVPLSLGAVVSGDVTEPGFAGWGEHGLAELHSAIRVGEGAALLERRGGGQDHVGELGCLGEEDVLHHQEVELAEALAHLVDVRVREEGVLAEDVHAPDVALLGGGLKTDDNGFLTDVEVAEAADESHAIELTGLFLESADQQHVAVVAKQFLGGNVWFLCGFPCGHGREPPPPEK